MLGLEPGWRALTPKPARGHWGPSFHVSQGPSSARGMAHAEIPCCGPLLCCLPLLWGSFLISALRQAFAKYPLLGVCAAATPTLLGRKNPCREKMRGAVHEPSEPSWRPQPCDRAWDLPVPIPAGINLPSASRASHPDGDAQHPAGPRPGAAHPAHPSVAEQTPDHPRWMCPP